MKTIKVTQGQFQYLLESEWNFHSGEGHDMKPYRSENRFMCYHETGQFGSGTYFSTYDTNYENRGYMDKYGDEHANKDPQFIEINNGLYRVDFDLYKNLYRVRTETQGDLLHTTLSYLNSLFHAVSGNFLGRYSPQSATYNNARYYQIIRKNCEALGLKCPSYMELTRMAQNHAQSDNVQSFSTFFMEYNGYNGVNVSGVPKFDNSRHGSVIYDLSKTSDQIVEYPVTPKGGRDTVGWGHTDSVATSIWDKWNERGNTESLVGKFNGIYFKEMNEQEKLRAVKNIVSRRQGFTTEDLYYMKDSPRVLKYIFNKMLDKTIPEEYVYDYSMQNYIVDNDLVAFINYEPSYRYKDESFLIRFLSKYNGDVVWSDMSSEEKKATLKNQLEQLTSKLTRDLTEDEKEYIQKHYYDVDWV